MASIKDTKEWKSGKKEYDNSLKESNKFYDTAIKDTNKLTNKQLAQIDNYKKTQTKLQNQSFALQKEEINQAKANTETDYQKEQSGAYVDWQKQSNQYGANAEKTAQSGLSNSGYSESSQVSMYNAYQKRVAVARESFNRTIQEYDNMMKEAYIQNSVALAEIANNTLQQRLTVEMQSFEKILGFKQNKRQEKADIKNNWRQLQQQIKANQYLKKYSGSAGNGKRVRGGTNGNNNNGGVKIKGNNEQKNNTKKITTYSSAVEYLKKNGASDKTGGLMTQAEWSRHKSSYQMSGQGGAEVKNYNSYLDYVNDYLAYCTEKER